MPFNTLNFYYLKLRILSVDSAQDVLIFIKKLEGVENFQTFLT